MNIWELYLVIVKDFESNVEISREDGNFSEKTLESQKNKYFSTIKDFKTQFSTTTNENFELELLMESNTKSHIKKFIKVDNSPNYLFITSKGMKVMVNSILIDIICNSDKSLESFIYNSSKYLLDTKWVIFLFKASEFSIGIYNTNERKFIYSFQVSKYTIRKKGGFSQAKSDNTKKISSAGSSIRRQQSKDLFEEIKNHFDLLVEEINQSSIIFWNNNHLLKPYLSIIFSKQNLLKINSINFEIQNANKKELDRCINNIIDTPCS